MSNTSHNQQQQQRLQQQLQLQRRLQQVQAEEAALKQQLAVQEFAANYPFLLQWPSRISGNHRTDSELLQHRLLEAGLLYEVPTTTADTVEAASRFVANLEATDCFHTVAVKIGGAPVQSEATEEQSDKELPVRSIHVTVKEKNWYRLHAGAGLKTDFLGNGRNQHLAQVATDSFLPTAEFELSAGLRNLAGVLDRTDLQYAVDTHQIGTWTLTHARPLYTAVPSTLSESILENAHGSQYSLTTKAALDTLDNELISSYKEYQRLLSVQASTSNVPIADPWYARLEWSVNYRDLVPSRHPTLPYHLKASPEIVASAGSCVKHAVTAHMKYDNTFPDPDDRSGLPVQGVQWQCTTELATPPGDVGFVKGQAALTAHVPLPFLSAVALHGTLSTGYLHSLAFQGLCQPPGPSDRFRLGGTGSFRGFVPAGIGPRSSLHAITKTSHAMGDALGGDVFYAATLMASTRPPSALTQSPVSAIAAVTSPLRLFGFASAGTCTAAVPSVADFLRSTRLSAGFGLATQVLGPRLEATYTWPLRYGPRDGRRRFQFGLAFSI